MKAISVFLLIGGFSVLPAYANSRDDAHDAAERRVLLHDIAQLRAQLEVDPLPADTSKLTLEMLRAEDAMLTNLRDERKQQEQRAKSILAAPTPASAQAIARSPVANKPALLTNAQFIALKGAFPVAEKRRISVIVHSPKNRDREDIIEVEIPPRDLWADLHGDVVTATVASLPIVLEKLDTKIEAVRRQARGAVTEYRWGFTGGQSGEAQARYTAEWIDQVMVPYLAKLRQGRK